MRLLVIDDEAKIADFLRRGLESAGYAVDVATDGQRAIDFLYATNYDLVILDLMLPDIDGLDLLKKIRNRKLSPPVLILSARDAVDDRVKGLEFGADDYLVKPFAFDELLARVRALLRRSRPMESAETLKFADLTLDTAAREARRGDRRLDLTAKEFDLIELFIRHPRQVMTREVIYDRIWGYDFGGESNIIEVYIRYLRQKTEAGGEPRLIHTVRSVGYVLREE